MDEISIRNLKDPEHAKHRIWEIMEELREITTIYGAEFKIETVFPVNYKKQVRSASEAKITMKERGRIYYLNHYFDGREDLYDGRRRTVKREKLPLKMYFHGCDENCLECEYPDCQRPCPDTAY